MITDLLLEPVGCQFDLAEVERSMSVILVEVRPQRIDVSYRTSRVEPARRFVEWLRNRYTLKIMDEEFNDLSAWIATDLNFLFGA